MSIPLDIRSANDKNSPVQESTTKDYITNNSYNNTHSERTGPHYDEFTTLLRKHLDIVGSELIRLKGSQSNEPGGIKKGDNVSESTASEKDMQAQEAKIHRVPPWEWREVKNSRAINPKLPTLIVSSKGLALHDAEVAFDQVGADPRPPITVDSIQEHSAVGIPLTDSVQEKTEELGGNAQLIGTTDVLRAKAERDQLRCLVDFMDSDMQDIFDVKRQVADQTIKEIAFEHLWLLYSPGDLVYTMSSPDEPGTYQAYRVLHVTGGRPLLDGPNNFSWDPVYDRSWDDNSESEERARDAIQGSVSNITPFIIDCFSIDFDGTRLGPKSRRFVIPGYTDQRRLDTLEVCPSFSLQQHERVRENVVERGRRFTQLAVGTHKRYSGRTLRESRELWESNISTWNYVIYDEEVHGEVMLDQFAAVTHFRKTIEKWRLKIGGRAIGVPTAADRRETFDPLPFKLGEEVVSDVFDDSIIDLDRRNDFVTNNPLLKYHRNIFGPHLLDDYVLLLPFRIYGYDMLKRKWFPFNLNLVTDITPDQMRINAAGYEDLVLPTGHKKLLQAIVKNQVRGPRRRSDGQEEDSDEFQMDVVKGKGKGLIILLHGAPGVGKTSTAECVAAQLKRPLLPITCGDISTQVKQAEETLQEYCALAYRWNCVLLLDEADVFLAKRDKSDIARNGLVSVFLRVLEYFSGVIILTTNRVGEFDEAFRSRIHVSLLYPKLDQSATLKIWERSLLRLRKSTLQLDFSEDEILDFAKKHWLDNIQRESRHWNGRQIRNAFQTALALANWDYHDTKQGHKLERPLLTADHFKRVALTSADFDDYISTIYNLDEVDTYGVLAARSEIRNDTHPVMSFKQPNNQDFPPRSDRTAPARRGASRRNRRADETGRFEGGGDAAKVRQLELELELMKLKQANSAEGVQAPAEMNDDDDEKEEEEEGW